MRLACLQRRTGQPRGNRHTPDRPGRPDRHAPRVFRLGAWLGGGAAALGLLTGCDTKSFFDPGEVGRYSHTPLTLPILDKIDPAVEEPNVEFTSAVPPTPEDLLANAADYRISKNDLLTVEVTDLQGIGGQTVKQSRVSESGNISLPFINQVQAEGYTEAELEQAIKDAYINANILRNPQISITVVERRGAAYNILGAVARPGQYAIFEPDFRLIDALTVAGEQTSPLLQDLYIIRRTDITRRNATTRPAGAAPSTGPGGTGPGGTGPSGTGPTAPRPGTGPAEDPLAPRTMLPPGMGPGQAPGYTYRPLQPTARAAANGPSRPIGSPTALAPRRGQAVLLQADPGDVTPAVPGTVSAQPAAPAGAGDRLLGDAALRVNQNGAPDPTGQYILVQGRPSFIGPATAPSAAVPPATTPAAPDTFGGASAPAPPATASLPPTDTAGGATETRTVRRSGRSGSVGATANGGFQFNDLPAPENYRVIRVPLDRLRNGEMQYNLVVRPKDTIMVQNLPIGEYYMGGHIARPGAYSLTQRKITLKQAVIAANMLDGLAIPERTDVIRRIGPGREVFVRVNLAKIFAGQQSDLYLKPDDQVMVGTNALAPFLAAARGAFRLTYGFGFLYDRNFAAEENNKIGR